MKIFLSDKHENLTHVWSDKDFKDKAYSAIKIKAGGFANFLNP